MFTAHTIAETRKTVSRWRRQGLTVGFVPTMGNLHDGHISLIRHAAERADRVVVSIFVNPLQFGPNEDFASYPRTLQADVRRVDGQGADLVFAPSAEEMYPDGPDLATRVSVAGLADILCGRSRPGHFAGVATVVNKLFNIVQPDLAVFGSKDYQQLAVIRRMVRDLSMAVEILAGATVREHDGLAMSSRNQYLSREERARAPALHAALVAAAENLLRGDGDIAAIREAGMRVLSEAGFVPEYFEIRDAATLAEPPGGAEPASLVVLAAAQLGRARLIDNLAVAARAGYGPGAT